ncbi:MAG: pur operon repressor [Clostridia bacterium]|nr:pur operon repressor [Clostridia bacterium]
MEKMRRSERIAAITKTLLERPRQLFSLNHFTELLLSAKSNISEDLGIIDETLKSLGLGQLETISGAAGGVKYVPGLRGELSLEFLNQLCGKLTNPERILPGGFIYMNDLIFDPYISSKLGEVFATRFSQLTPDYIITVETKGIPLALMTAHSFSVPLVIIRDNSNVSEGSSVSINYVSGSTRQIHTMSLSRRALPEHAKVLIIDDFMKAGGTARGMMDLMAEFNAQVLGIGVFIGTVEPRTKLVDNYVSLLELERVDGLTREVIIRPSQTLRLKTKEV